MFFWGSLFFAAALPLGAQNRTGPGEQLYEAIVNGDIGKIEQIIKNGMDLNAPLGQNSSPLVIAIKHKKPEVVRLLLDRGADVNLGIKKSFGGFSGGSGRTYILTPLYLAVDKNNQEIVRILIEHKTTVYHPKEGRFLSVLVPVLKNENMDILELLLANGLRGDYLYPDLLYKCLDLNKNALFRHFYTLKNAEKFSFSPKAMLEQAVVYNNPEIVRFLVNKGTHKTENTALHLAVDKGYVKIMPRLRSCC